MKKGFLMSLLVVFVFLLVFVFVGSASTINPEQYKKTILESVGVSYETHEEFAAVVAKEASPFMGKLDKPLRIGFATPSFDISDAWERMYWSIVYRLKEAGIPFEMSMQATSSHDAHNEQLSQIESLIASGVDFIILGPTELDAQRVAIEKIHQADIPLIILNFNRPIKGDKKTLLYTAFDHEFGGALIGQHIVETFSGKGKLAGLRMIPGTLDNLRWGGAMGIIEGTDIEVVYETYAKADRQLAYEATRDIIIAHPDIKGIYATSSAMALGAVAALDTMARLDVHVWGFGGTVDEVDAMLAGKQTGSVYRFQDDMGIAAAQAIQYYYEGHADKIPQSYMGEMTMSNNKMTKEEFTQLAEKAYRYSKIKMGTGL